MECFAKTASRVEPGSSERPAYSGPLRLISGRERRSKMSFMPGRKVLVGSLLVNSLCQFKQANFDHAAEAVMIYLT
jgi:hypothetical protein